MQSDQEQIITYNNLSENMDFIASVLAHAVKYHVPGEGRQDLPTRKFLGSIELPPYSYEEEKLSPLIQESALADRLKHSASLARSLQRVMFNMATISTGNYNAPRYPEWAEPLIEHVARKPFDALDSIAATLEALTGVPGLIINTAQVRSPDDGIGYERNYWGEDALKAAIGQTRQVRHELESQPGLTMDMEEFAGKTGKRPWDGYVKR